MQYEKIKIENNKIDRWMRLLHSFYADDKKINHFYSYFDFNQ